LFKLFCLKDRMFNSFIKWEKEVKPASIEVMVNTPVPVAMEIENGLKLPVYTDTEILMDDLTLSPTEFMNRFEKFQGWNFNKTADGICLYAKDAFDASPILKCC